MSNLHVVFTMNPASGELRDRAATSPALFNRCVLDWFGDWSLDALFHVCACVVCDARLWSLTRPRSVQVAMEFTSRLDLDSAAYLAPNAFPAALADFPHPPSHRQAVINAFVHTHQSVRAASRRMVVTPRHYLDFIQHFVRLHNEKRSELEDQQLHINIGMYRAGLVEYCAGTMTLMLEKLACRSREDRRDGGASQRDGQHARGQEGRADAC